ncbi:MAG: hypothetical protein AAGE94_20595, partial [Acidobacteriota bacterium]
MLRGGRADGTEAVRARRSEREVGALEQLLHERVRVHSRASVERIKAGAADNDLFTRLAADDAFAKVKKDLNKIADPRRLVGRAPRQVKEFLRSEVRP